jgi:hypothetical protein
MTIPPCHLLVARERLESARMVIQQLSQHRVGLMRLDASSHATWGAGAADAESQNAQMPPSVRIVSKRSPKFRPQLGAVQHQREQRADANRGDHDEGGWRAPSASKVP